MLFANDIVLVNETRERVNAKLEQRRQELESRCFKLSWNKAEYMEYSFSTRDTARHFKL